MNTVWHLPRATFFTVVAFVVAEESTVSVAPHNFQPPSVKLESEDHVIAAVTLTPVGPDEP
jgi:hypothetical protein